MKGDAKVLTFEYTQNNMNTALFGLKNLQDHECMVFETCQKQQLLYTWKAELITPELIKRSPSLGQALSEISGSPQHSSDLSKKSSVQDHNTPPETNASSLEQKTDGAQLDERRTASANPAEFHSSHEPTHNEYEETTISSDQDNEGS